MKINVEYIPTYDKPIWYFDNVNHLVEVWDWRSLI